MFCSLDRTLSLSLSLLDVTTRSGQRNENNSPELEMYHLHQQTISTIHIYNFFFGFPLKMAFERESRKSEEINWPETMKLPKLVKRFKDCRSTINFDVSLTFRSNWQFKNRKKETFNQLFAPSWVIYSEFLLTTIFWSLSHRCIINGMRALNTFIAPSSMSLLLSMR